jgi:hypothetical protein
MTKEYLWSIICKTNPSFSSDDSTQITLSSRGLKKMFELVWKEAEGVGYDRGIEVSKQINKFGNSGKSESDNFMNDFLNKYSKK